MSFKTISVIGLGYIGLPTAAMFAINKVQVIGVDVNQSVVDTVNSGRIHIVEPELGVMVKDAVSEGYLRAVTNPEPADAFLIAVPTPFLPTNADGVPKPDLKFIQTATQSIAKVLKKGDLVVLESTSPVGTTEKIAQWLSKYRTDLTFPQTHGDSSDIRVAYCPERVLPGHVVREIVENDRIIGGMTESCSNAAVQLYKVFVEGECVITNTRTAEMAKLTENASRDVNIAFANELSIICDKLGINVWELITLANRHPRVNILQPGPGVGGHCIAVDPWFIAASCPDESRLIRTARHVNDGKPAWVIQKVNTEVTRFLSQNPEKTISDIVISCYGLSFKPNIDDLRESPALSIAKRIMEIHKAKIMLVEPNITKLPDTLSGGTLVQFEAAVIAADIHILLVDHSEFIGNIPRGGYVIDTRGVWT